MAPKPEIRRQPTGLFVLLRPADELNIKDEVSMIYLPTDRSLPDGAFHDDHLAGMMPFRAIAVGTAVARRPPHRSRRAELPHRALALDDDEKPLFRPGVLDARIRQVTVGDSPIRGQASRCFRRSLDRRRHGV